MDEDIIIPFIVFTFIFAMVAMVLAHVRWKAQHNLDAMGKEGTSMGTSELKALMREAVEEANAPLLDRIAQLEEQLDETLLLPAATDRLDEETEEPVPARRRSVT